MQRALDAAPKIHWYGDALQLRADREKDVLFERVLACAGGAGLEMRAYARYLVGRELTIDVFVHPAKDVFAAVAVQW